jgi:hypothetical protein
MADVVAAVCCTLTLDVCAGICFDYASLRPSRCAVARPDGR